MANLGIALGAGFKSAIQTYGDMLNLINQQRQYNMEQQERDASQNASAGPAQPVDKSMDSLVNNYAGADGKADPDAVMSTYGRMQSATTPQEAQAAYQQGAGQAAAANAAATPSITQPSPQQPMPAASPAAPAAPTPPQAPAGGIGAGATGSGAPMGFSTPQLKAAIGGQESGNNPASPDSAKGAVGQMQITPGTFKLFAKPGENIRNVADNNAVGYRMLDKYNQDYNGDPQKVAVAYFSGPGNVNTDPNATTPWKRDVSDGKVLTSQYVAGVMKRLGTYHTVNSHGGSEVQNAAGDTSTPPVTPDTKLTDITAKALPSGINTSAYTFNRDAQGNITMQPTVTASQRAMAAAQKAFEVGDFKNAGPLMQAATTLMQQEAVQHVNTILQNPGMSEDEKVGALAKLSGAQAYKTENGSYLVPGLGPVDRNGNPAPMSYQQVAALSTFMTTPEGLQHALDYNISQQRMQLEGERATSERITANAAQSNAEVNRQNVGSEINLRNQEAQYYGGLKEAQTAAAQGSASERSARAADLAAQAQLRTKISDVEDQMAALPKQVPIGSQEYNQQMQHLQALHAALLERMRGGVPQQPKQTTMEPGKLYTDPDHPGQLVTPNANTGTVMPKQMSDQVDQLYNQMRSDPARWQGFLVNTDNGTVGVKLRPDLAAQYGLNPNTKYPDLMSAQHAIMTSPKFVNRFNGIPSGDTNAQGVNPGTGMSPLTP